MTTTTSPSTTTFDIGGMTCASCVGRIERALSKVDGVTEARVNLATEVASVTHDSGVEIEQLTRAITNAGYTATPRDAGAARDDERELASLRRKWQVALATGLGLMVLMYVPLHIDTMDWLMPAIFVVATVVQFWAGRGIYAAAWAAARHGATNMNTLVALGTGVAYGYSTFVTLWPGVAESRGLPLHVYYESSLVIIALVLAGKSMEARANSARTAARAPASPARRSGAPACDSRALAPAPGVDPATGGPGGILRHLAGLRCRLLGPLERDRRPGVLGAENGEADRHDEDAGAREDEHRETTEDERGTDDGDGDPLRTAEQEPDDVLRLGHAPMLRTTGLTSGRMALEVLVRGDERLPP